MTTTRLEAALITGASVRSRLGCAHVSHVSNGSGIQFQKSQESTDSGFQCNEVIDSEQFGFVSWHCFHSSN